MTFTDTSVQGAKAIRLDRICDHRGYFARGWCADELRRHGLHPGCTQLNVGFSHFRGTLRGMHYQIEPRQEAKLVRCTRGVVFDVVIDLRPASPTFCRWHGTELSADNDLMLYIPEGCAHGYQTLTDNAEIYYLTSAAYDPAAARGVRFDDPAFGIDWPVPVSAISDADESWPNFPFRAAACARPDGRHSHER